MVIDNFIKSLASVCVEVLAKLIWLQCVCKFLLNSICESVGIQIVRNK